MKSLQKEEWKNQQQRKSPISPQSKAFLQHDHETEKGGNLLGFSLENGREIRVAESFFVEKAPEPCYFCKHKAKASSVVGMIKTLSEQVKMMKEENYSIQEEIELLCANFSYILELVEENITTQTRRRIKEILEQKNKIISKQVDKIRKLEEQHFNFESKLNSPICDDMEGTTQKTRKYRHEESLKKTTRKLEFIDFVQGQEENQGSTKAQTDGSDKQGTKVDSIPLLKLSSQSEQGPMSRDFKLRKKNTYGNELKPSGVITSRIKSLDNLKDKINRLKNQLQTKHKY